MARQIVSHYQDSYILTEKAEVSSQKIRSKAASCDWSIEEVFVSGKTSADKCRYTSTGRPLIIKPKV